MMRELPSNHDLSHLRCALSFVKNFRTVIDGGAHQGIWTRALLEKFNNVIAFEPWPDNFKKLPEGSKNYRLALGNCSNDLSMAPGKDNSGQYHLVNGEGVEVVTIDDFDFEDVDFLKLDVEGYELFAIEGARATIEKYHPVVLIEENGLCERYGVRGGEAGEYLEDMGYEMVLRKNKDYVYRYCTARG